MIKTRRLFFVAMIFAVATKNLQVSTKPIEDDLDNRQISANNETTGHSRIEKRDLFDWIYSYILYDEGEDVFDSYFDDSDEEAYLICRNCTVIVNGATAPSTGVSLPVITEPPLILAPTPPLIEQTTAATAAPVTGAGPIATAAPDTADAATPAADAATPAADATTPAAVSEPPAADAATPAADAATPAADAATPAADAATTEAATTAAPSK